MVHESSQEYGWHVGCGVDCHLHVVRPTYHSLHVQSSCLSDVLTVVRVVAAVCRLAEVVDTVCRSAEVAAAVCR